MSGIEADTGLYIAPAMGSGGYGPWLLQRSTVHNLHSASCVASPVMGKLAVKDFKSNRITNKIFIKDSTFLLPAKDELPMIMVGPGTGVVPFIGFMEEKEARLKSNPSLSFGNAYLFFGCRYSNSDFIYKE